MPCAKCGEPSSLGSTKKIKYICKNCGGFICDGGCGLSTCPICGGELKEL